MEVIASLRKNGAALFATGIWEAFYQSAMVVRGGDPRALMCYVSLKNLAFWKTTLV